MAKMSMKEKAVLTGVGVFILYAITVGFWFLRSDARVRAKRSLEKEIAKVQREKKVISEAEYWNEQYEAEVDRIPVVASDKHSDTVWSRVIADIAVANNILIEGSNEHKNDEEWSGEMDRIVFDVKWTGSMESLVKFLYALQNSKEGLFDVQALNFSPLTKYQGFLKGNILIVCMFKKAED